MTSRNRPKAPARPKQTVGKKTNKTFMILSFIGILMVVSAHIFNIDTLKIFDNFFPFNSFFMPMFIFISGYFFKDKYLGSFWQFFKKKFKNLLVYYFVWNLIYGVALIIRANLNWGPPVELNLYTLFIQPFVDGQQLGFNAAAWFVPVLFTVEISYWLIRKLEIKIVKKPDSIPSAIVLTAIFMSINILIVTTAKNFGIGDEFIVLAKIGFFMIFYYLGVIYHRWLEKYEQKIPTLAIFIACPLLNGFLMMFADFIYFGGLYSLGQFGAPPFFPILTSITGILFWLRISRKLEPVFGDSKVVNLISDSTKDIMMHHVVAITATQILCYSVLRALGFADDFHIGDLMDGNGWFFYEPQVGALFFAGLEFLAGVFAPLWVKNLQNQFLKNISLKFKKT